MKQDFPLPLYLSLCFLLPMGCVAVQALIASAQNDTWQLFWTGFAAMSPTIAAMLTVLVCGKKSSLRFFFQRCFASSFRGCLIALALLIPILELIIFQLLITLTGRQPVPLQPIGATRLLMIAFALIAEEMGWRGFLQNELKKRMPSSLIPLCTGLLWTLWHYHFYLSSSMTYPMLWFLVGCVADSYLYFWITQGANGSIIPASIMHFSYNLVVSLVFTDVNALDLYPLFVIACVVVFGLGLACQTQNKASTDRNS